LSGYNHSARPADFKLDLDPNFEMRSPARDVILRLTCFP
jgi:hypothetical protein